MLVAVCVFSYGRLCWVVWVAFVWRFMVCCCVFAGLFAGVFAGLFAGVFAGLFAGVFAGVFAGLFAGVFAGLFAGVCFLACLGVWQSMFALRVSGLASGRRNLPIGLYPSKTCRLDSGRPKPADEISPSNLPIRYYRQKPADKLWP